MNGWKPALAVFLLLALTTRTRVASWNDSARMATIDSLVERHTFAIDASPFVATNDKIRIDGHFYSNKPPVMEAAGAAVLLPLHEAFGLRLRHDAPGVAYYLLTLILVGIPTALTAALLDRWFRRSGFAPLDRHLAVVGFAIATLAWPYSTVFNNHTPAGALLLAGVLLLAPDPPPTARRTFWAGLALGLSATVDLAPGALFIVVFLVYALLRQGARRGAWFVAGLVPPAVLQLALQLVISGDLLPTNLHREYWDYPGSPWIGVGISGEFYLKSFAEGVNYAFHSLVGSRGFLSYSPFLVWGLVGLFAAAWASRGERRAHALATLAAVGATTAYMILFAALFGGVSYGDRYFVGLTGVIVCFTASGFWTRAPRWRQALLAIALGVSAVIAGLGVAVNPWRVETPVAAVRALRRAGPRYALRHLGVFDLYVTRRPAVTPPAPRSPR